MGASLKDMAFGTIGILWRCLEHMKIVKDLRCTDLAASAAGKQTNILFPCFAVACLSDSVALCQLC